MEKTKQRIFSIIGKYENTLNEIEIVKKLNINADVKLTIYKEMQERVEKIKSDLKLIIDDFPNIIMQDCSNVENETKKKNEPKIIRKDEIEVNNDYKEWKNNINIKVNGIYDRTNNYSDSKKVLNDIYIYMRNVYGIVWEQEFKEWKNRHVGIPKTLDVIYENKQNKALFDSILNDRYEKALDKRRTVLSAKELAMPLIEKNNDRSNGGCVTLRNIYHNMELLHNVNWDKQVKRYTKETGNTPKSKSILLYWNHGLVERFRMTIDCMMSESY